MQLFEIFDKFDILSTGRLFNDGITMMQRRNEIVYMVDDVRNDRIVELIGEHHFTHIPLPTTNDDLVSTSRQE